MPSCAGARLDERQRRLRALLHHVAELPGEDQLAAAGHARRLDEEDVAAHRRPREARRHARHARAHRHFGLELRGPRIVVQVAAASIAIRSTLPSAMRTATWRSTAPISRSRLRTPASRV